MNKQEAYKIVFDDLINSDCHLFTGTYDATSGDNEFMYGIATVMEYIAYEAVGEDAADEFEDQFIRNMIKSKIKARKENL